MMMVQTPPSMLTRVTGYRYSGVSELIFQSHSPQNEGNGREKNQRWHYQ